MPIRLIDPTEEKTLDIGGTTFRIRQAPCDAVAALKSRFQNGIGRLDDAAFRRQLLIDYLIGWEDLEDAAGEPIEFSPAKCEEIAGFFPEFVAQRLDMAILALMAEGLESGKDSENGSGG